MGRTWGTTKLATFALLTAVTASAQSPSSIPSPNQQRTSAAEPAEPMDAEIRVANPFATPWLLADPLGMTEAASRNTGGPAKPPDKRKYKLEPDPFNAELPQSLGPSGEESNVGLSSRALQLDTAQRLAASQTVKLNALKNVGKAISAKYDVTRIGDRGVGANLNFYSIEKEQALGRELSQQVEQQAKFITDPVISEYVNRIGQTLVRHSDVRVPFTIRVVDDEQVNAFALPGGFFYVNSGLLLVADSEAELAGVMAHEIAHVAARHATRNATKAEIWNLASLPLVFVAGPVGAAIRQVSGIAVPMSFLKFNRDAEREADFLGLEYQYAAGWDPTAFVDFLEKLESREKQRSGVMARAFSTHPMNSDRIHRAESELEMLPARDDYILTTSEFDQVKARLIALTRGRSVNGEKSGVFTLRKHTAENEKPPVLRKKTGALN